jgi:hypothetical protein
MWPFKKERKLTEEEKTDILKDWSKPTTVPDIRILYEHTISADVYLVGYADPLTVEVRAQDSVVTKYHDLRLYSTQLVSTTPEKMIREFQIECAEIQGVNSSSDIFYPAHRIDYIKFDSSSIVIGTGEVGFGIPRKNGKLKRVDITV